MQRQLHDETELYRLEYDRELDCVLYTWKKYASGEDFRRGANAILEYFENHDVNKLIVDTSGIKAHTDEDKEWLAEVWTPKIIEAGMEHNCVVYPEGAIVQMDRKAIEEQLSELPYNALWTADMQEARDFIAQY